ncbi:UNVERIFIED_CONTAM: hypothetical protein GTU68_056703 [Idotea baltica]|nr:hypothetical protein [Idotea baltica]
MGVLEELYPGLKDAMYQVSCEEEIDEIEPYCATDSPPVTTCEKEHVMICIRFRIGARSGVLLLDPGYHVAQPIVVMSDAMYPHTGPWEVRKNASVTKMHNYAFHPNPAFVLWSVVETKEGEVTSNGFSLIHVTRPFLSAVDISERRNLVYPFKSLLHRNQDGDLTCGLYFRIQSVEKARITLFYVDGDEARQEAKVPLSFFLTRDSDSTASEEHQRYERVLSEVEARSVHGQSIRSYLDLVVNLLGDEKFLEEFIQLNDDVDQISRDN